MEDSTSSSVGFYRFAEEYREASQMRDSIRSKIIARRPPPPPPQPQSQPANIPPLVIPVSENAHNVQQHQQQHFIPSSRPPLAPPNPSSPRPHLTAVASPQPHIHHPHHYQHVEDEIIPDIPTREVSPTNPSQCVRCEELKVETEKLMQSINHMESQYGAEISSLRHELHSKEDALAQAHHHIAFLEKQMEKEKETFLQTLAAKMMMPQAPQMMWAGPQPMMAMLPQQQLQPPIHPHSSSVNPGPTFQTPSHEWEPSPQDLHMLSKILKFYGKNPTAVPCFTPPNGSPARPEPRMMAPHSSSEFPPPTHNPISKPTRGGPPAPVPQNIPQGKNAQTKAAPPPPGPPAPLEDNYQYSSMELDRMQSIMTELLAEQNLLEKEINKSAKARAKTLADKLARERNEKRMEAITNEISGIRRELRKCMRCV